MYYDLTPFLMQNLFKSTSFEFKTAKFSKLKTGLETAQIAKRNLEFY